ncbi:MAG: hypothetical protein CMK07_12180 [Ponticaulis sp.]|nr:hypothetical protein [Ponticaulis sp.]
MNLKTKMTTSFGALSAALALSACQTVAPAAPLALSAAPCTPPPVDECVRGEACGALVTEQGPAVNAVTGRNYYLDYSCGLTEGEPVNLVLNLHGGGSYGNWQRHYFPIKDFVEEHNLVVVTPNAPPQRWGEVDDEHLETIIAQMIDEIGADNIRSFWLAGHSQGGMTSRRIVCTDFFADKVDGMLSLSGGRLSRAEMSPNFYRPSRGETGPRPPRDYPPEVLPECEFSHIYTTGELEIVELPDTSSWADQLGCDARVKEDDVVDTEEGYVFDSLAQENPNPVWGLMPGPGTAEVFVYPNCDDGRVVADVIRLDKGHTEGLEPVVTEKLVELMLSAKGGKIAGNAG